MSNILPKKPCSSFSKHLTRLLTYSKLLLSCQTCSICNCLLWLLLELFICIQLIDSLVCCLPYFFIIGNCNSCFCKRCLLGSLLGILLINRLRLRWLLVTKPKYVLKVCLFRLIRILRRVISCIGCSSWDGLWSLFWRFRLFAKETIE